MAAVALQLTVVACADNKDGPAAMPAASDDDPSDGGEATSDGVTPDDSDDSEPNVTTDDVTTDDVTSDDTGPDDGTSEPTEPVTDDGTSEPTDTSDPDDAAEPDSGGGAGGGGAGGGSTDSGDADTTDATDAPSDAATTGGGSDDDTNEDDTNGDGDGGGGGRNLLAEPGEESAPGVAVTDNAFEIDTEGQLRWFFVVENGSELPACGGLGPARLYDENGVLLAGGSNDTYYLDENLPAFFVGTYGALFRDPALGLRNCIPAGGRGIGVGDFVTQSGITVEARDQLLSKGARIEFDLDLTTDGMDFEPADDLFELSAQKLTDTPEGKVASATMTGHATVIGLQFYAALFDGDTPVDLVSMGGGQIEDGATKAIEMPPGNSKATRFELYIDGNVPR
jgi:hypothetical protein